MTRRQAGFAVRGPADGVSGDLRGTAVRARTPEPTGGRHGADATRPAGRKGHAADTAEQAGG
ncbi:hypothetical protein [Streptomyces lavendofoliae]|uniref:hypothetical protein n=1 Tax=Streptomyces lavendofoliae TaxID=67314 RepID=UPI003D8FA9F0